MTLSKPCCLFWWTLNAFEIENNRKERASMAQLCPTPLLPRLATLDQTATMRPTVARCRKTSNNVEGSQKEKGWNWKKDEILMSTKDKLFLIMWNFTVDLQLVTYWHRSCGMISWTSFPAFLRLGFDHFQCKRGETSSEARTAIPSIRTRMYCGVSLVFDSISKFGLKNNTSNILSPFYHHIIISRIIWINFIPFKILLTCPRLNHHPTHI